MAYSSFTDARTKLLNPQVENSSVVLYGDSKTLSTSTTFYTNAGLTSLAAAGNYVIPMNYLSYYVTIGSNGKMTSAPQPLNVETIDTSWVDDSVYQNETKVSNTNWVGSGTYGGTEMSLNTTTLRLTDNLFTSRPAQSGMYKVWVVNGGTKNTANLTNIDLSDMRGYDLQIMSGDWQTTGRTYNGNPTVPGFSSNLLTQTTAIVHLAADPNRVTQVGNVTYIFKPDYFLTTPSYDPASYHKRLPNTLSIRDSKGYQKQLMDLFAPNSDLWYRGATPSSTTRVRRTPTRHLKGQYTRYNTQTKKWPDDQIAGEQVYYYETDYFSNVYDQIFFSYDEWIKASVSNTTGTPPSQVTGVQAYVMMQSLAVDDNTWATGSSNGINYRTINPYHWTTQVNSGTANQGYSPTNQLLGFLTSGYKVVDMDWEVFGSYGTATDLGTIFNTCWQNAKTYAINNNQIPSGGFVPELGIYEAGPYNSDLFGQTNRGWSYVLNASSLSDLKTKQIFKDYNDYLIAGTQTWQNTITNDLFRNISTSFNRFYISRYNHYVNPNWYFYAFVHNYDITKKILVDVLGASPAESKRAMSYFWHLIEPVDASDLGFERKGFDKWTNLFSLQDRSEVAPSMMQSAAVWAMAYADGIFLWSSHEIEVEDREAYAYWVGQPYVNEIKNTYSFGNLTNRQHGLNDWLYVGYRQILWNKDIVEANTSWLKPELYFNNAWVTGQDNQPTTLCYQQAPISAYKLSADGTEALLIITNPFNNGYTKTSTTLRLPAKSNAQFTIDTWGTYTTVVRIKLT
jgi:hypothetical protein